MDLLSETAVAQGMVLASLIGGVTLAAIAQLASAFPRSSEVQERPTVDAAVTRLALAATLMMVNVWSGIIFFLDEGGDRQRIAILFYGGLLIGVLFFALGMAETVAIASPRLRTPILTMFGALIVVEALLAFAFLR
jgi:hypothetical protein